MDQGWVKIHRKLLSKGWASNPKVFALWVHILLKANHEPKEFFWNGKTIIVKQGQFISGRRSLAKETGLNQHFVDRTLRSFENEQQIEQQKTTKYRLITVLNWSEYQGREPQNEQQVSHNRATTEHKQECKNEKNEKNVIPSEQSSRGKEVARIMGMFIEINPALKWDNKTERRACAEMLERFKYVEEVQRMAEMVIGVQGERFAPRATTPLMMWKKLADFKAYFDGKNRESIINKDNIIRA